MSKYLVVALLLYLSAPSGALLIGRDNKLTYLYEQLHIVDPYTIQAGYTIHGLTFIPLRNTLPEPFRVYDDISQVGSGAWFTR